MEMELRSRKTTTSQDTSSAVAASIIPAASAADSNNVSNEFDDASLVSKKDAPLRILMATEYLPPYVSGIANRCKNLVKGYRSHGHHVTVAGPAGTIADIVVPSVSNVFYPHQRMFILPPFGLFMQLLNFFSEVPYDIVHVVGPLCLSFLILLPFFKLRGVKIYVSYHVYLEYYKTLYLGDNAILGMFAEGIYTIFYFLPLVWFADTVGIPSKTADHVVFKYSRHIHYMKSGLDTSVFTPLPQNHFPTDDSADPETSSIPVPASLKVVSGAASTSTPLTHQQSIVAAPPAGLSPVLVYVGRLAVEKNIEFLISSLSHPNLKSATLVIVGDGPIRSNLESLAAETVGGADVYSYQEQEGVKHPFGLGKNGSVDGKRFRVIFAGMVRDEKEVSTYYASADVFVSASGSETFGFTVAEAMACGTPAVVVRGGAFATVYRMIDGWMFEEENVDDYAGRVGRVLTDAMTARRLARRVAVRGFSVDAAIRDLLKTYQWCVDGDGKHQKRIEL